MGQYPPGSTFKPMTAIAAMEEHLVSEYESLPCTPDYTAYKQVFDNWTFFDRPMALREALETSCDTYFYALGEKFYKLPKERGPAFQQWAARLGFGEPTGIDIGAESAGLLPDPAWRRKTYEGFDREWKPGHSIQLSIGQGDLTVTPLQMARFYALLANGGRLVTPYVVADAEQPGQNGGPPIVKQRFTPPAGQTTDVDPAALEAIREGLYLAANGANGTATGVFGSFPVEIAGTTGTAEKWNEEAGWGPTDDPEVVVCALIENGGHGGSAAAPAALKVFESYFHRHAEVVQAAATD
jgi:penicillin-binding protein 2